MGIGGQASGDFRQGQSALRILYSVVKDTIPVLAADGLTQANPAVVTTTANKSTTIPVNVKRGVLGGSVAFLRPDIGPNTTGGPVLVAAAYVAKTRPVGLFISDAVAGNYETTSAVGSGKNPHLRGGSVGVKIYETQQQIGGSTALTYTVGDRLYASVNGLLTNRWQDSYEAQWITAANLGGATSSGAAAEYDITCLGTVTAPPDANNAELFLSLAAL